MLHKTFQISYKNKICVSQNTELTILSVGLKKKFASMHLFKLCVLNFFESPFPHALNRDFTDIEEPPIDSLLSESTSPLH